MILSHLIAAIQQKIYIQLLFNQMQEEKKFTVKITSKNYYLPARSSKQSTLQTLRAKINDVLQPNQGQFDQFIFSQEENGQQVIETNQDYQSFLSDKDKKTIYYGIIIRSNKQAHFQFLSGFSIVRNALFGSKSLSQTEERQLKKKTLEDFVQLADQQIKQDSQRVQFVQKLNENYELKTDEKYSMLGVDVDEQFKKDIRKYTESIPRKIVSDQDPFINIMLSYYEEYLQDNKVPGKEQKLKDFWRFANWKTDKTEVSQTTYGSVDGRRVSQIKLPDLITTKHESNQIKNIQKFNNLHNTLINQFQQSKSESDIQKSAQKIFDQTKKRGTSRNYGDEDWFSFVKSFVSLFLKRIVFQKKFTYFPPKNDNDGILPEIKDNDIVAVIGDWGTGMRDSIDLVQELVDKQSATIVIHLGDTYYTGNAKEHKRTTDLLNNLRVKMNKKGKKFRFYLVPGNHDYYFGGKQFYDEFKNWNEEEVDRQKFSFFCLRYGKNYQIIGMDSGRNGAKINTKISTLFGQYDATQFQKEEVEWAKKKILQFQGQTILITHHQPFTPFQEIAKDQKVNKNNKHINNLISQQLFDVLPKISCWVWGHEHRFAMYKPNVYGIPLCRLVGNSAWQNNKPDSYQLKFRPTQITDSASFPKTDENGYFWLTGMTIKKEEKNLKLEYIHMKSSYDQPSKRMGQKITEVIRKPLQQGIKANKVYYIKDASGLSYSLDKKNQLQINSIPTKFVFIKADQPHYDGQIKQNMNIYVFCPNSYRYLSFYNSKIFTSYFYLRLSDDNNKSKFYFRKFGAKNGDASETLRVGDTLSLFDETNRQYGRIFREKGLLEFNVKWNYEPVSNKDRSEKKIEYKGVQIYNLPYENSNIVSSTSVQFNNIKSGKTEEKEEAEKIDQTCRIF